MKLLIDSQERHPLEFVVTDGVEIVTQSLPVGDYQADGQDVVVERKSISDLFTSFSSNYEAERNKIIRAKTRGLKYILAIEGSIFDIRKGHEYRKDGEIHQSKKSGISQIRQLMTICVKYDIEVHYFSSRQEMAFWILEYFLAYERIHG